MLFPIQEGVASKMILPPEAESLLNDKVQGMRDRFLTTQFGRWQAPFHSHVTLSMAQRRRMNPYALISIVRIQWVQRIFAR